MDNNDIIMEGTPCWASAMAVATFGFVLLGVITIGIFIIPEETRPVQYIIGGITGTLALLVYPWQIRDKKTRKHILHRHGLSYCCGILSRFEVDVPYRSIQAITVRQGVFERLFSCGDVRVSVHGVSGPVVLSQQDMNSICIRAIPDYQEVARILREKMNEYETHTMGEN